MKIVLLLMGVALFAGSILAGELPPDPRIGLAEGGGSTPTDGTFTFQANGNGGGTADFYNDTEDTTFFNLSVTTPNPPGSISCYLYYEPFFSQCAVIPNSNGTTTILFYGTGEDYTGVYPGGDFIFLLNDPPSYVFDPNGSGTWNPYQSFTGAANTPEPGSITLFVTFLGILAAKGKFRRRPNSSA